MNHTKGYWELGAWGDGKAFIQLKHAPYTGEGEEIALVMPKYARLIAAAPDMKEALEKMFNLFVNNCSMRGNTLVLKFNPNMDIETIYDGYCKLLGETIAKAEGK